MATDNASLARRWLDEVWNQRRVETVEELLHDDGVCHSSIGELKGKAGFLEGQFAVMTGAFPDIRLEVEDLVSSGDTTVSRWVVTGTHTGEGLGFPPTGRTIRVVGTTWVKFLDGKMIEGWDYWDRAQLYEALGVAATV
jgi:steroid delta-isomerase-like uncharacterized protein